MRVLIIEPAGGLWGSERALLDLIGSMPTLDLAVCCPPATPLVAELQRRGVTHFPWFIERLHEKSLWQRAFAALGILRACLAFRPTILYLNQGGAWRVALPAATLLNLPTVCHVRIFEDAAYLASRRPRPRQLKAIITISHAMKAEIRAFTELDPIPVYSIYDAYVRTAATPATRENARIACVGRLTPIKGQSVLLQALAINETLRSVACLIIGDGDTAYVKSLKEHSPPAVEWLGFVQDVARPLGTCGVLVCPSYREPLGRVIFEAWDVGAVPVVFSGSGGAAEVVAAADGGVLYERQTPQDLGDAISKALTLDGEEVKRLVANGRAWLEENCAPDPNGHAVVSVLRKAMT